MRREIWAIGNTFGYAVRILNSIFCTDTEKETEFSEDDKWLIVEQVNSLCSEMMIDDTYDILRMVQTIPYNRLCEKISCMYHHPKDFEKSDYPISKERCNRCSYNKKSKTPTNLKFDFYEI